MATPKGLFALLPICCFAAPGAEIAYTIETDGDPYLTRILLSRLLPIKRLFGIGVYLHRFHRPDIDQHLHNHPWRWAASLILNGSYHAYPVNTP